MFRAALYVCLLTALFAGLSLAESADAHELNGYQYVRWQFVAQFHNPYDNTDVRYGYADRYDWYYNGHYQGSWDNSGDMYNRWIAQGWHYDGGNWSHVPGG